jgi:hypothetical protein
MANNYNENKIVYILDGGKSWKTANDIKEIPDALELYLENDLSVSVTNQYEDPIKEILEAAKDANKFVSKVVDVAKLVNQVAGLIGNVRLTTKYTGAQAWTGSSPLSFNLSFNFYMGMADEWDGKTEVYLPIAALGRIFMATTVGGLFLKGPGPSYAAILTQMGQSIWNNITGSSPNPEQEASAFQKGGVEAVAGKVLGKIISIQIGKIYKFNNVIPKNFSYSFSKETDAHGYPISGSCSVTCETVYVATAGEGYNEELHVGDIPASEPTYVKELIKTEAPGPRLTIPPTNARGQ